MASRILQANLNRAVQAQDMFLHQMAALDCGLGVASEPSRVPENHPCWAADRGGKVAITWRKGKFAPPCHHVESGRGWVAVAWGKIDVVGCYIPHGKSAQGMEIGQRLGDMGDFMRRRSPRSVIVAGDFNAHSGVWGSRRTNPRGRKVAEWGAEFNLCLLNKGQESTCVRAQGESIIDLTWATPEAARMVQGWRVAQDLASCSDHLYIVVEVLATPPDVIARHRQLEAARRRWTIRKMEEDILMAVVLAETWPKANDQAKVEDEVSWAGRVMRDACDASMPRSRQSPRRAAYW